MPSSASFKNFAKSPRGQGCPRSLFNQPCHVAWPANTARIVPSLNEARFTASLVCFSTADENFIRQSARIFANLLRANSHHSRTKTLPQLKKGAWQTDQAWRSVWRCFRLAL